MRKFRLLMSKYGFSMIVMLLELLFVFWLFFYLGDINQDLWILVVTLLTIGTIFSIVNHIYSRCGSFDLPHVWRTTTFSESIEATEKYGFDEIS